MTIIARIGLAIAFASLLVRPALAAHFARIEPLHPSTPTIVAATTDEGGEPAIPKPRQLAPADEYFGHSQLSVLGIRNLIGDINRAARTCDVAAARDMTHKLTFVEDALHDWQAKYPDDTWIPKFGYALLTDFNVLSSALSNESRNDAGVHAVDLATWLEELYPASDSSRRDPA